MLTGVLLNQLLTIELPDQLEQHQQSSTSVDGDLGKDEGYRNIPVFQ